MASFTQYALQLARFPSHKTAEYIKPADLPTLTCISGKSAVKLTHKSKAIKECVEIVSQLVSLITNGPQPGISYQQKIIDRLLQQIQDDIKQFDTEMSNEYKCSSYIDSIAQNISNFSQYIPTLISASAPSLSQYIPNFQEIFQAIETNFDSIIAVFNGVSGLIKSRIQSIEANEQNNQIGALIHLVEILQIYLIKFENEEPVAKNESTVQTLEQWITTLGQFTDKLYQILGSNNQKQIATAIQTVSTIYPSIFDAFQAVKAVDPECAFFNEATQHVTAFVQFVTQLEYAESYNAAESSIQILSKSLITNDSQSLISNFAPVKNILNERVKESLYGSLSPDAIAIIKSLDAINIQNTSQVCESYALALIVFATTCCMRPFGYQILSSLSSQCFNILNTISTNIKTTIGEIASIISTNESVYEAKKLSYMNYYLKMVTNSKAPQEKSHSILAIKPFLISSAVLPQKVDALIQGTDTEDQFTESLQYVRYYSPILSNWTLIALLTESNTIITRADFISSISAYGAILSNVQSPNSAIQTALQSAPRFSRLDVSSTLRTLAALNDTKSSIENMINLPEAQPVSAALKSCIEEKNAEFSLSDIIQTADQPEFISLLEQLTEQLIISIEVCTQALDTKPQLFAMEFSFPFSLILLVTATVESQPTFAGPLAAYPPTMKGYLDVLWPLAIDLATKKSQDVATLQMYSQEFIKPVQEMKTTLQSMPQPSLTYEISEELKAVRSLQAANNKLQQPLKGRGQKLISIAINNSAAIPILTPWFTVATQPIKTILQSTKAASLYLGSDFDSAKSNELSQLIIDLLVSIAAPDIQELSKPLEPLFEDIANDLISALTQSSQYKTKCKLLYLKIKQVEYIAEFSSVKQVDAPSYVSAAISSISSSLSKLIQSFSSETLSNCFSNCGSYLALTSLFPEATPDASKIQNYIQNIITIQKSNINELVKIQKEISIIFKQKIKSVLSIDGNLSNDQLIDALYDFFEDTRFCANAILRTMKQPEKIPEYVSSAVRQFVAGTTSVIYLVSLSIIDNPEGIITGCIEIINSLPLILQGALGDSTDKSNLEFRRGVRNVAKQVDTFINLVESPQHTKERSEFENIKMKLLQELVKVIVEIMKKVASAVLALQEDTFIDTLPSFNKQEKNFEAAFTKVKNEAVGKTKKTFIDLYEQLTNAFKTFNSTNNNYSLPFPPLPVIDAASRIASSIQRFYQATQAATNVLIIDPDPEAAQQITDFKPNSNVTTQLTPADALDELMNAMDELNTTLTAFKEVIENDSATSDEILKQADAIKKTGEHIVHSAFVMAAATTDKALQVEQRTNAHSLSSSIQNILNALKSRLMRNATFENDMKEALSQLNETSKKANSLADSASKIVVEEDDVQEDDGDEVSNELRATAAAISDMSNRLAQFSAQLEVTVDIDEIGEEEDDGAKEGEIAETVDLQAEEGTMAAYVIGCAQPVIQTAAEILAKSQEICKQLRGQITNEGRIIKCAREVTESSQLLIISAEIAIQGTESDPEYIAIAASKMIKASIEKFVSEILSQGGDPEGVLMKKVKIVRRNCDTINKKVESIAKQKWITAHPVKKSGNRMVLRLQASELLNKYRKELSDAEAERKRFRRDRK